VVHGSGSGFFRILDNKTSLFKLTTVLHGQIGF